MLGEFEFGADNFCGYQWRDSDGEHMCFETMQHPWNRHKCECGVALVRADRGRAVIMITAGGNTMQHMDDCEIEESWGQPEATCACADRVRDVV